MIEVKIIQIRNEIRDIRDGFDGGREKDDSFIVFGVFGLRIGTESNT